MEDAGSDERVTHLSFQARGIDRASTEHLGPSAAEIERRAPGHSDRGDCNRDIKERNHSLDALVAELAALDAEIAGAEEERLDARYGTLEPARPEPAMPITSREAAALSFDAAIRPDIAALERPRDDATAPLEPQEDAPPERTPREAVDVSFEAAICPAIVSLRQTGETWIGARLWQATVELYHRGIEAIAELGRDAAGYWQRFVGRDPDADRDHGRETDGMEL